MSHTVTIGTPLSDTSMRVLLLGGGELGKEVVIAFQRLGVEVHVADRYPHSPAMQVAHYGHVVEMTSADAVLDLIATVQPNYIVPEVEAIAVEALAQVEETTNITVVPNARAVATTMDRQAIRTLAAHDLGLPTSPYAFAATETEMTEAAHQVGFPCFIKPTMSSSGHGQSLVKDASELAAAWLHAHDDARAHTGRVIVEGMVDFDYEITVLTVRTRTAHGHCTMVCAPIGHRQVGGDYVESWQPQPMTERAWESAQTIATTVVDALGGYGLYGVELFIKGDEVIFSEVSPRPHDTGMVTMATQRYSEFDLHARAILGLPIDTAAQYIGASAAIKSQVESTQPRYTGLLEAVSVEETDVRIFGKPVAHPGRRMGVAISRADSVAEARERACEAASLVHVEA